MAKANCKHCGPVTTKKACKDCKGKTKHFHDSKGHKVKL
jgi:hypothetical protein